MKITDIKKALEDPNALLYIAMSIISSDKNTIIPELLYLLNSDNITKFIALYGGERIYIPKPEEFNFFLRTAVSGYYITCKNMTWEKVKEEMNFTEKELYKVKNHFYRWKKNCSKEELELLKNIK